MHKRILFALWLLVPVAMLAYHFGPGQARLEQERAAQKIAEARTLEALERWPEATQAWADALAATPADKTTQRIQIRLAHANARTYAGELPEAMADLEKLLGEVTALYTCGPAGGGGIRTTITPRLNSVSCFVPRELVPATFTILE